jgi:3-oxoacyl-[acyl-carrier protein] reductase
MTQHNKRIVVTGATGGIGTSLSRYLIKKGYDLLLTARSEKKLAELSMRLEPGAGQSVSFCVSDYAHIDSFAHLVELAENGGVDGLVLMPPPSQASVNCLPADNEWHTMLHNNFVGPLALIRELLPALKMRLPAKIAIILGVNSVQVFSNYAISNVIASAWAAEMKTLAHALGPEKIHVNALSLGGVMTDKFIHKFEQEAKEKKVDFADIVADRVSNVPLRKYAVPAEVAQAVEAMLSDFSNHITGLNVLCDGGFTRAY